MNTDADSHSSSVDWEPEGDEPAGFTSNHIRRFCEREKVSPALYHPVRMAARLEDGKTIAGYLPRGWLMVLDEYTENLTRKHPIYNQKSMRDLCVLLRVPYWERMKTNEMKAVIVRWARFERVPETKI